MFVPRKDFKKLSHNEFIKEFIEKQKRASKIVTVLIDKNYLSNKNAKWSFFMNDIPVSAKILDESFFDKLKGRDILLGSGDLLEVKLEWVEHYDQDAKFWIPDVHSYIVLEVFKHIPKEVTSNFAL